MQQVRVFPFVKTGGLADYTGSLTKALSRFGHEVAVFIPGYRAVIDHPEMARAESRLVITGRNGRRISRGRSDRAPIGQAAQPCMPYVAMSFSTRRQPYGFGGRDYDDNDRRFIFLRQVGGRSPEDSRFQGGYLSIAMIGRRAWRR